LKAAQGLKAPPKALGKRERKRDLELPSDEAALSLSLSLPLSLASEGALPLKNERLRGHASVSDKGLTT